MQIIVVIGAVCSGKNTYADRFSEAFDIVDIGDIVRAITKTDNRTHNIELDKAIIEELHKRIIKTSESAQFGIAITGIRQKSILNYIEKVSDTMGYVLHRVYLEVPEEVLRKRYHKRNAIKDTGLSFEEVMQRDNKIGYEGLVDYIKTTNYHTIQNYNKHEIDNAL